MASSITSHLYCYRVVQSLYTNQVNRKGMCWSWTLCMKKNNHPVCSNRTGIGQHVPILLLFYANSHWLDTSLLYTVTEKEIDLIVPDSCWETVRNNIVQNIIWLQIPSHEVNINYKCNWYCSKNICIGHRACETYKTDKW